MIDVGVGKPFSFKYRSPILMERAWRSSSIVNCLLARNTHFSVSIPCRFLESDWFFNGCLEGGVESFWHCLKGFSSIAYGDLLQNMPNLQCGQQKPKERSRQQ